MKHPYRESITTLVVTIIVLSSVLVFLKDITMKWTFWTFFVGLLPFVVAAIRRDMKRNFTVFRGG